MKVCPKCNAHYEDDTFFCLQDGTPLEKTDVARHFQEDSENLSEETFVLPSEQKSEPTVIRINDPADANKSEATVFRQVPPAESVVTTVPQSPKSSQGSAPFQNNLASTRSDKKHFLRTVGITGAVLLTIIGLCAGVSLLDNLSKRTLETSGLANENANGFVYDANIDETDEPADSESTNSEPTNIEIKDSTEETPDTKPTPKPPQRTGTISGKLIYPGEGIPSNLQVCVTEIRMQKIVCSNKKTEDFTFKVNRSNAVYSVSLPEGEYLIYAFVPGQGDAYYTEFVKCGMSVDCRSHKKITISVKSGRSITGITVGDWYDF